MLTNYRNCAFRPVVIKPEQVYAGAQGGRYRYVHPYSHVVLGIITTQKTGLSPAEMSIDLVSLMASAFTKTLISDLGVPIDYTLNLAQVGADGYYHANINMNPHDMVLPSGQSQGPENLDVWIIIGEPSV